MVMFDLALFAAWFFIGLWLGLKLPTGETAATTITVTVTETKVNTGIITTTVTKPYTTTLTTTVVSTRITGGVVEYVCFSRVEQCDSMLINLISQARKSIYVAMYSFTRDGLASALVDAKNRGVEVKVIMEEENAYVQGSDYRMLKEAGVDVRLDGNPALMHHKFMIVDGELVVTGSYNWSTAAEDKNDENFVVIRDKEVVDRFTQEFNRLLSIARP
jgi:phosphatidylserine/phosphatidylglycerophosphate/cardiolipin synthase-like enzyme